MQRIAVIPALLLLTLAAGARAAAVDATVLALGDVQQLIVDLDFIKAGEKIQGTDCTEGACIPLLQSAESAKDSDAVVITYAFNTSYSNYSDGVTGFDIRACYSKSSFKDRPWRFDKKAVNPSESKQCKIKANKDGPLAPEDGTFTWKLPNNSPESTMFIRVYTICGKDDNGNTKYCTWGQGESYYTILKWDTTPAWLIGVTVPLICLGPTILASYFAVRFYQDKKRA